MSCSGKLTSLSLDNFYSVGSICTTTHVLKLALSRYLMGRVTVRFGHLLFVPVPGITSNRLLFLM